MNLLPSLLLSPFLHYPLSHAILLSIPFKNLRLLQYRAVIHIGYRTIYQLQFCKTFTFSLKKANSKNMQISTFCRNCNFTNDASRHRFCGFHFLITDLSNHTPPYLQRWWRPPLEMPPQPTTSRPARTLRTPWAPSPPSWTRSLDRERQRST